MKGLQAALWTEGLKLRKSKMIWVTILVFFFISIMMGFLMLVAKHPNIASKSAVIGTKASLVATADWTSYLNLLLQLVLTVGSLGFGIATSWIFGREFADRVVKDMLALPVSRTVLIEAKFIVLILWCLLLSIVMFVVGILSGLAVNLDGWSGYALAEFIRTFSGTAMLTILLVTPVAFIASAGRGYLMPVGFSILILIITQFVCIGIPFITPWFPWAFPALFSGVAGKGLPVPGISGYVSLFITSILGFSGTLFWWNRADQK
jgi:ABC-2 type transport system permease protein